MGFRTASQAGAFVLAAILGLSFAGQAVGIRLNHTASMPIGVWLARGAYPDHVYAAGDIIEACPPLAPWQQVYLAPGHCPTGREPMLKPIAAVAGDSVAIDGHGITVNGQPIANSAPLAHDTTGRPLQPYVAGTYTVHAGEVWLLVPRADSLDSRYLGPVSVNAIRALAAPVWTWR